MKTIKTFNHIVLLISVEIYLNMVYHSNSMVNRNLGSLVLALALAIGCGGSSTKRDPNHIVTPTPTATEVEPTPYMSPTPSQIDPTNPPIETATPDIATPSPTPYQTSTATPIPVSGTPTETPIPTEIDPTPIPSATGIVNMAPEAWLLIRPGYEVARGEDTTLRGGVSDPDNTNPISCQFIVKNGDNEIYRTGWQNNSDFTFNYDLDMSHTGPNGLELEVIMTAKDGMGAQSAPAIDYVIVKSDMQGPRPVAIACRPEERNLDGKCELTFYYGEERRIDFGPNGTGSYVTVPGRTIREARFVDDSFGFSIGEYDRGNNTAIYIRYGSENNGETIVTSGRVELEDSSGAIDSEDINIITRSQ